MKRRLVIAALALAFIAAVLATESQWQGTDDSVVASMAGKAGVQGTRILPWNLNGDLQLFVFAAGGVIAGFVIGYYWRTLFGERSSRQGHDEKQETN